MHKLGVDINDEFTSNKMAVRVVLCTFFVLQYLTLLTQINGTTVDITIPVQPVIVGGILALQCQIQNMENRYTVKMFRVVTDRTEEITSGMTYHHRSTLGQRVFVTQKSMQVRNTVYFMTIVNLSVMDSGKYICKVYDLSTDGEYIKIADDSIDIDVYYLPDAKYPQCSSYPADTQNMHENTNVRLQCVSPKGIPTVNLRWKDYTNQKLFPYNQDTDDVDEMVFSDVYFRTASSHNKAVFVCEMTSPGFPNFIRTCQIGPITIQRNIEVKHPVTLPPRIPITENVKSKTEASDKCNTECSTADKYIVLYLSVATIGAGMLSLVFLTTTIIWCCKYSKISADARAQRNMANGDGSEPVYVSLQTRPDNDQNAMVMSVDDPNNPGNKVTMPKEVFDEFYRSLTLKKDGGFDENVHV